MLRFAFCGFDHGATSYATNLLRGSGIHAGHEEVFSRVGVRENAERLGYQAEVSYATIKYLTHPYCDNAKIVHWLRHPVDQINSWLRAGWHHAIEQWARELLHPIELPTESVPYLASRMYHTNMLVEQWPDVVRLRAEDRRENLHKLGLKWSPFDNPTYNSHEARQLTKRRGDVLARVEAGPRRIGWADLPPELADQYLGYGYEPSDSAGLHGQPDASEGRINSQHPPAPGDIDALGRVDPVCVEEM